MKLEKSMQLGELYRELRIARGLKLKDVARENLSVSQLSRFENGQSMLAADKLLIAISGIHMTFAEFGHAINNYQEPKLYHLVNKAAELYNKQDIEGLRGLLESDIILWRMIWIRHWLRKYSRPWQHLRPIAFSLCRRTAVLRRQDVSPASMNRL